MELIVYWTDKENRNTWKKLDVEKIPSFIYSLAADKGINRNDIMISSGEIMSGAFGECSSNHIDAITDDDICGWVSPSGFFHKCSNQTTAEFARKMLPLESNPEKMLFMISWVKIDKEMTGNIVRYYAYSKMSSNQTENQRKKVEDIMLRANGKGLHIEHKLV